MPQPGHSTLADIPLTSEAKDELISYYLNYVRRGDAQLLHAALNQLNCSTLITLRVRAKAIMAADAKKAWKDRLRAGQRTDFIVWLADNDIKNKVPAFQRQRTAVKEAAKAGIAITQGRRPNIEMNDVVVSKLIQLYMATQKIDAAQQAALEKELHAHIGQQNSRTVRELQGRAGELTTNSSARTFVGYGNNRLAGFYRWLAAQKNVVALFQPASAPAPTAPANGKAPSAATPQPQKLGVIKDFSLDNTVRHALIAAFHAEEMKKEKPFGQDRETGFDNLSAVQITISYDIEKALYTVGELKGFATGIIDNKTPVWQPRYTYPFCAWVKEQPLAILIGLAREAKKVEVAARPPAPSTEPRRRNGNRPNPSGFSNPWANW